MSAGILFDVDGTLVDTSYLHTVCWWQALRQLDFDVPMAHIHRAIGMGSDRILDHLLEGVSEPGRGRRQLDDDERLALHTAKKMLYSTYWDRLRPLPGAPDLLRACANAGLSVVLASSASKSELEKLRAALDCDDVLSAATSSADVIFVGDSVWDVEAAGKLKIPCIGLTSGGLAAEELRNAGALECFASPRDLHGHLADSAPVQQLFGRR